MRTENVLIESFRHFYKQNPRPVTDFCINGVVYLVNIQDLRYISYRQLLITFLLKVKKETHKVKTFLWITTSRFRPFKTSLVRLHFNTLGLW